MRHTPTTGCGSSQVVQSGELAAARKGINGIADGTKTPQGADVP